MRILSLMTGAVLFVAGVSSIPASAQTPVRLAKSFAAGFETKTLGKLDGKIRIRGKIKVVITNSLADPAETDADETRSFTSFAAIEKWLRSRETRDGLPNRNPRDLKGCKSGRCEFDLDDGILHNNLYIQEISYRYYKGRIYIREISLLDGN
jgi:hypothetical protein